jgi:hypothetical protein
MLLMDAATASSTQCGGVHVWGSCLQLILGHLCC